MAIKVFPETPDGRYFVAKGRLWRKTNPAMSERERDGHVKALMEARRAVRSAETEADLKAARARVEDAKRALGERGPVWWSDGASDESRKAPWNSSYAKWWEALPEEEREKGRS
ncbi:hypothetical protein AADZ90_017185 [Aestuariibius sp. 2305UL40-4]|uniref:hypothetical protein n=1 Tax=Aestuariibius violaceus TaxID=3234132 RepID=UPI00345E9B05